MIGIELASTQSPTTDLSLILNAASFEKQPHFDRQQLLNMPKLTGATTCELSSIAEIGADMLRAGGSAADAMVAMVTCIGVASNYHAGIGGGGFALLRTREGEYKGLDFRVQAPVRSSLGTRWPSVGVN